MRASSIIRRSFSSFQKRIFQEYVHQTFNQSDPKSQDLEINQLMQ